ARVGIVEPARNNWPLRVTIEKIDNDLLSNPGQELNAIVASRPAFGNSHPTGIAPDLRRFIRFGERENRRYLTAALRLPWIPGEADAHPPQGIAKDVVPL